MKRFALAILFASACGTASEGGMNGPSMNNHVEHNDDDAPEIQSNDILARDAVTKSARVQHILISWKDMEKAFDGHQDERAQKRSRQQADELAVKVLERVRAGEPMEALMKEFSEDSGSAKSGEAYTVDSAAQLVFEFKRMSMRLNVGEAGLVKTMFGWHVIKRVE
jgi:peptidyl-prolyl cis-trans isomerase D